MPITQVDVIADFGLTLDHFYGILKKQLGTLSANSYLQIQATAIPFDVSNDYKFFSLSNIAKFGNKPIAPVPVSDLLLTNPLGQLSSEYYDFITQLLALVEVKELDPRTLEQIDKYETSARNLQSHINNLLEERMKNWLVYADATMTPRGEMTQFYHWCQGQAISIEISQSMREASRLQALAAALRLRKYADPSHQLVVDAYAKFISPASRTRYPIFDDRLYGEEQAKFNPVYFAKLEDNDSNLFKNRQITTVDATIDTIATKPLGGFTDKVTKKSEANSKITTDWSVSGKGGWGPISFSANSKSHQEITDDFKHTQAITVGTKSLMALEIDFDSWMEPTLFNHPLIAPNRGVFERFFGEKGTLLYVPTHIIVARGFHLEFHSDQNWKHDYKSDFSAGGSASARIFGFGWGGGGNYSKSVHEQTIETRGHDLILDDGDNVRLIGFNVFKNTSFAENIVAQVIDNTEKAFYQGK